MSGRDCWCRDALKSKVRIGANSEDKSLNTLGLIPSGPAALEMFRALRSLLGTQIILLETYTQCQATV